LSGWPQGNGHRAMIPAEKINAVRSSVMSPSTKTRIGVAGYGFIGRHLCQMIRDHAEWGLELVFVWNRDPGKPAGLPDELVLTDLGQLADRSADLVVECAHPGVTARYGETILRVADYLPLSVNA